MKKMMLTLAAGAFVLAATAQDAPKPAKEGQPKPKIESRGKAAKAEVKSEMKEAKKEMKEEKKEMKKEHHEKMHDKK
jgi:hypothetical protein